MKYQERCYVYLSLLFSSYLNADIGMGAVPTKGLLAYWYALNPNTKLAIECLLVLGLLYVVTQIFGCKRCVGSCGCDKTLCRSVGCKGEDKMMKNLNNHLCPCGCGCSEESCQNGGCKCSNCSCPTCK